MGVSDTMGTLDRRQFLTSVVAGAVGVASWPEALFAPDTRPNLLFILADDLGYGDLSAFGRPDYRTPNIDRLVADGVRFTNAYAAASTCTPTRVAFMTGRYPQRLSADLQRPMPWSRPGEEKLKFGLPAEHPTVASLLKNASYHTSLIGKWHLGFLPENGPIRHGFDEFFGIRGAGADYFTHTTRYGERDLWEGEVPAERIGYLTDLLTERAVELVNRKHERPFYLSLHYTAPHWPWEGPADKHGAEPRHPFSEGGSKQVFAEMVRSLDAGVGRVLSALRRAKLERDTLVIFTSDNGGERYSLNAPWSNGKFTLWEGGIRVPLIMRWPARLPRGGTATQLTISMDWAATLLAAAGASPDPGYPLDGIDLTPFARRKRTPVDRQLFWRQPYPDQTPHAATRRGKWKYLRVGDQEYLFDVTSDPGEKVNLKAKLPEVFARLREQWRAWDAQMVAT
ncbi:MAG: sulfatase-like hydrolase/transferase [Gemmatimonadaceae bacterium]